MGHSNARVATRRYAPSREANVKMSQLLSQDTMYSEDDPMAESQQGKPDSENRKQAAWWIRLLSGFFSAEPGDLEGLFSTSQHSAVFEHRRARFILLRTMLVATLFGVLTPLWIPIDVLAFPHAVWRSLALGRVATSLAFAALALYCRRAASLRQSYMALAVLFLIPSAFFLFSHAVLWDASLSKVGAVAASGYAFLPFVLVAGVSVFPLTVRENIVLVLPLLAISGIPVIGDHAFMMPGFNAVAVLWLLILVAAVGIFSAASQLQLMHDLFTQSVIDPLTGVFNRRSGTELVALQLALARRHRYPLALVFVDLDDFKQVNDTAGHAAGDSLLAQTAQGWHAALRESDAILRWGGEEFILLLPHTDCAQAAQLIRSRSPALRKPDGKPLTYSIGIAEWLADGVTDGHSLVALSDRRMYQAKAAGKARIVGCAPGNHALSA